MKAILFFLLALPCLGQTLNPFQVELNDSLKKVVRLYIAKEEKKYNLSYKKNAIYVRFNPGINQWFIGTSVNYIKGLEHPPMYLSKVDNYWVKFDISAMDEQVFIYPKEYIDFYKKNVLSLLEEVEPPEMETIDWVENGQKKSITRRKYPPKQYNYEQWRVIFHKDEPIDIKITL